jgi:hypothetical protein
MSVVLAVASTGLATAYQSFGRAESSATVQHLVGLVFQRLDREVRYASDISTPALVGGDAYVEYLTTVASVRTCVELRLQNPAGQLQRRTWAANAAPVAPVSSVVLATGVSGGADMPSATMPFATVSADVVNGFDRLRISLRAAAGKGGRGDSQTMAVTFAAVNSTRSETPTQPCVAGRGVA